MTEAEKLEAILKFVELDPSASVDDFKAKIDSDFILKAESTKTLEVAKTKLKTLFKMGGVEFEAGELSVEKEGKKMQRPLTEVMELGFEKLAKVHSGQIEELTAKAGDPTEAQKKLEEKFNSLKGKYEQTEGLLRTEKEAREKDLKEFVQKEKSIILDTYKKDWYGKLKFVKDKDNEFTRAGFENKFEAKFEIGLDDDKKPYIKDRETDSFIKSDDKAATFKKPEEVLRDYALEKGLLEINPNADKTVNKTGNDAPPPPKPIEAAKKTFSRPPSGLQVVGG